MIGLFSDVLSTEDVKLERTEAVCLANWKAMGRNRS
jgi:hypothetical protein